MRKNKPKWLRSRKSRSDSRYVIGMMADRYLRDHQIGIMADRLDFERLRGFDFRRTDRRTDICNCRVAFATEKCMFLLNIKQQKNTIFFQNFTETSNFLRYISPYRVKSIIAALTLSIKSEVQTHLCGQWQWAGHTRTFCDEIQ